MKYIEKLDENFKLVNVKSTPLIDYTDQVNAYANIIAMEELHISEKAFSDLDRLESIVKSITAERKQEYDTILSNCHTLKFRPNYCAEIMYHTLYKGRLDALATRSYANGGFAQD